MIMNRMTIRYEFMGKSRTHLRLQTFDSPTAAEEAWPPPAAAELFAFVVEAAAPTLDDEAPLPVALTVRFTPPTPVTELPSNLFIGSAEADAPLFLTVVLAYFADLLD